MHGHRTYEQGQEYAYYMGYCPSDASESFRSGYRQAEEMLEQMRQQDEYEQWLAQEAARQAEGQSHD